MAPSDSLRLKQSYAVLGSWRVAKAARERALLMGLASTAPSRRMLLLGWALIRLHCAPDLHTIDDVSEKWISTRPLLPPCWILNF
jgi:hypothetical protein